MNDYKVSDEVAFWIEQIDQYESMAASWERRSKKIVKRYMDDRSQGEASKSKFNILWSNVQTLGPALFDRNPIPNIDRRFQTEDKVGTVSAQILERCVSYFVDDNFNAVIGQVVQDRLLSGRGIAWVRYVPNFKTPIEGSLEMQQEGVQGTDDELTGDEAPPEELYGEDVVIDYVHWCDFGHSYGRTWQEVRAVWRRVPMTRRELIDRFGEEVGRKIPMEVKKKDDKTPESLKRAAIYEVWDKKKKQALWICKDYPYVIDLKDDPLKLKKFFPCPAPLYATIVNDNLIPTPDYIQYQDQAQELDELTARINLLTRALKVAGVYDASAEGLDRLLMEGHENKLIPVSKWAVYGEKGMQAVVAFLPIVEIATVLEKLYFAREKTKQDLYEITGISDVIRGATDPNETLGAQELKGKYAGLRIGAMQKDVARFCRDIIRIYAEIIGELFSIETVKSLSGFQLLTMQEKQMIQMQQQMAQQGIEVPPIPEEQLKLMEEPTWEEVFELIKNDTARCYRIEIETDSTIKVDQDAEKQARNEFLTAVGGFMQQAVNVQDPDIQQLLMELLRFGVKGYKISREIETQFDVTAKKMKERAANPQPDPAAEVEKVKADMEMKKLEGQMQIEQVRMQGQQQMAQAEMQKIQLEQQSAPVELQLKAMDIELKKLDIALKEKEIEAKKNEPIKKAPE